MRVNIPYGGSIVTVDVPEANLAGMVRPNPAPSTDEGAALRNALANPVGSPPLDGFFDRSAPLVIIVNDAMRPTPTAHVLRHVHDVVSRMPDVMLIVATGTHRRPTDAELDRILGDLRPFYESRTCVHDARRPDEHRSVGVTSRGNDILLDTRVADATNLLIIGSVEPHYFAGYTGGRKSLLPGVAAFESVERNHAFAMDPASRPGALEGNPVSEDMVDAARLVRDKRIFTIMTVLDSEHRICYAAAGDIEGAFASAVGDARSVFEVPVPAEVDVVVAVATPPLDIDLYQSHKALEHGRLALRENGILILVSECREGVGERSYIDFLERFDSPQAALGVLEESYRFGHHKVAHIADMACRSSIWAVTSLEDPAVLESVFMSPFPSLQNALDEAIARTGPGAKVLFLMDASVTVPRLP